MNSYGSKDALSYKKLENLYKILESKRTYENLLKTKLRMFKKRFEKMTKNNNSYNNLKKKNFLENEDEANEFAKQRGMKCQFVSAKTDPNRFSEFMLLFLSVLT